MPEHREGFFVSLWRWFVLALLVGILLELHNILVNVREIVRVMMEAVR